jgi:hypothetical protein
LDAWVELILSTKWGLLKDWERPTKRAITAIIMHSNKTSLKEAKNGITSQKPNDHKGLWWLCKSQTCCKHAPSQPNKASRRKPNKCFRIIKTTHDFFKGSLSNITHLRQVMLQQKNTKHTIKTTSSMAWKSLSRSLNNLLFIPLFCMKLFLFPNTIQTFLRQLFWWKPT